MPSLITFFDTETTGKPQKNNEGVTVWPRVTQLAYVSFNRDGKIVHKCESLIIPDGWEVPKEKFFIDNNMSTERCQAEGRPGQQVFEGFVQTIEQTSLLVAHNLNFDMPVMGAELKRYGLVSGHKPDKFCTMLSTVDICKINGPRGYKWPKLEELHRFVFGCDFENAHDALSDVLATAKCFFELKKRGLILTEKPQNPFQDIKL